MWYVLEDAVPAGTTRANARETSIKVHGGVLHTIFVTIPPGGKFNTNFQLRKGGYYILPRNEDKSMTGEHLNVPYKEWLELPSPENRLTLKTWNDSTDNAHHIRLLIGVLKKDVIEIEEEYLKTLKLFMRLFRRRN